MKTKKEILEHCIEIYYEQLFMQKINLKYIEEKAKAEKLPETLDMEVAKNKVLQSIEGVMLQIKIAKEMLDNE